MKSYYRKEEVLREPSLEVGQKLRHSNEVLEHVLDIMDDLEDASSSEEAHLENREREKWLHFAEDAETYYQDAEYILGLLNNPVPTERREASQNLEIYWENPSKDNQVFELYQLHEENREEYKPGIETSEFQLMLSEAFRYRQIMNEAQGYDLPSSGPFEQNTKDAEIVEGSTK